MIKVLLFPFYMLFWLIELPFKFIWWCLKTSVKITLAVFIGIIAFALILTLI